MSKRVDVKSNLLLQNCFLRELLPGVDIAGSVPVSCKYVSLDEVVTATGVELRETVNDYPVTPESVDSYLSAADYKQDPLTKISTSSPKVNLGNMVDFQAAANMSSSEAMSFYEDIKARAQASLDALNSLKKENKNENSEVKDNAQ